MKVLFVLALVLAPAALVRAQGCDAKSCVDATSLCYDALGGGNITARSGDFPRVQLPACGASLDAYFSGGAYARAVEEAVKPAYGPLGLLARMLPTPEQKAARAKKLVIFDIDETLISNVAAAPGAFIKSARAGGAAAGNGRRRLQAAAAIHSASWTPPADAPPLKPSLQIYKAICGAGYSIALITGRHEGQRALTAATLKAAGYGGKCAAGERNGENGACCYTELVLRAPGDKSLASVYKPRARGALLAKLGAGGEIFAAFGDQYSDLNGENAPQLAYKLPNPFYFIL